MHRLLATLVVTILTAAVSSASPAESPERKDFDAMVARVKRSDASVDFDRLRRLYVRLDGYNPSGGTSKPLFEALARHDAKAARTLAEGALEKDYLDVDAHMVATVACRELGDTSCADHHLFVARGILESILASGDGKSHETAMFVVSVAEEYAVARALGLAVVGQRLEHVDGHAYDVLTVDDEGRPRGDLYFDVDAIWAAEQRMFQK